MFFGFLAVLAGNFTPPGAPSEGSNMKTLDQIYCKLMKSSIPCTPLAPDVDSPGTPVSTMHTLEEIYEASPSYLDSPADENYVCAPGAHGVTETQYFYVNSADRMPGTRTNCYRCD